MKVTNPIVRIRGWRSGNVSPSLQKVVEELFSDAADYDDDQIAKMIDRLKRGRSVALEFDTGDEDAARAFMQKVASVGLHATLHEKPIKFHMYHGGFEFFAYASLRTIVPAVLLVILAEPWLGLVLCAIVVGALVSAFAIHIVINRSNRPAELLEHFDEDTRAG